MATEPVDLQEVNEEKKDYDEDDGRKLPTWMTRTEQQMPMDVSNENQEAPYSPPSSPTRDDQASETLSDSTSAQIGATVQTRVPCKYGESCYRRNPAHKAEFSHPGDDDYSLIQEEESPLSDNDKPECQYGTSCYRQNPQHKRDFKHTQPPHTDDASAVKNTRNRGKRRRTSDPDYESDGDNDYDLEDSFIDDEEETEEENEEEDEDYVPENKEVDAELLKEEQWKPTSDDSPEVLELLQEARDYLRNKKLHK